MVLLELCCCFFLSFLLLQPIAWPTCSFFWAGAVTSESSSLSSSWRRFRWCCADTERFLASRGGWAAPFDAAVAVVARFGRDPLRLVVAATVSPRTASWLPEQPGTMPPQVSKRRRNELAERDFRLSFFFISLWQSFSGWVSSRSDRWKTQLDSTTTKYAWTDPSEDRNRKRRGKTVAVI